MATWTVSDAGDSINPLCSADGAVPVQHSIVLCVTNPTQGAGYTAKYSVVGANNIPLTSLNFTSQQVQGCEFTATITYPAAGAACKGNDVITIQVFENTQAGETAIQNSETSSTNPVQLTKCWEKGLLYQQQTGDWSTTPQSEGQPAGKACNTVGQGRGIVTPHKDIVCLYPELVLAAVEALNTYLQTIARNKLCLGLSGASLVRNYSAITKDTSLIGGGCAACETGLPMDITIPAGSDYAETEPFTVGKVQCVVGVVIDAVIWYPITGYNPQQGDYLYILDNAVDSSGTSMPNKPLKWPLASGNPQLRAPIVLRGQETVWKNSAGQVLACPSGASMDTAPTGAAFKCVYGIYKLAIKLCHAACRNHTFKIEFGGMKVVTAESQRDTCVSFTPQQQQGQETCFEDP